MKTEQELLALLFGAVSTSQDDDTGQIWVWAGHIYGDTPGDGTRECRQLVKLGVLLDDDPTDGFHCFEVAEEWKDLVWNRLRGS